MLTDTKLRNLKPQDKLYKVNDCDGLYVAVTLDGAISSCYNYSIHVRQQPTPAPLSSLLATSRTQLPRLVLGMSKTLATTAMP